MSSVMASYGTDLGTAYLGQIVHNGPYVRCLWEYVCRA